MPRTDLPKEIQEAFFDFHWVKERLWRIEAPVEQALFADLEWLLNLPIWARSGEQKLFDLRPMEVLSTPAQFPDHAKRIEEADLSFPLILMLNLRNEWVVMDGYHRLAKARLLKIRILQIRKLPRSVIPLIERTGP